MFQPQSRRKPKFLFSISIKELTNIPKPSGSCYIRWHIKDTTGSVRGETPKAHIRDYKVQWNYNAESLIKLKIDRSNKQLLPKILVLEVFLVPHHHQHPLHRSSPSGPPSSSPTSTTHNKFPHPPTLQNIEEMIPISPHKSDSERQYLGKVEINLSELVQFNDKKTTIRNLLMDSKINAILKLSIGIELIKGNREDFIVPAVGTFKRKGMISSVLGNESGLDSQSLVSPSGARTKNGGSVSQVSEALYKPLMVVNDPIVAKLYEKTFELSWDVRPGEYNALETVEDILQGGDGWAKNEDGVRLNELLDQTLKSEMKSLRSRSRSNNGKLINVKEVDIRPDLRSWNVTHT